MCIYCIYVRTHSQKHNVIMVTDSRQNKNTQRLMGYNEMSFGIKLQSALDPKCSTRGRPFNYINLIRTRSHSRYAPEIKRETFPHERQTVDPFNIELLHPYIHIIQFNHYKFYDLGKKNLTSKWSVCLYVFARTKHVNARTTYYTCGCRYD